VNNLVKTALKYIIMLLGVCVIAIPSEAAQNRVEDNIQDEDPLPLPVATGRVAESSVGVVGQRQVGQTGVNVAPMGRVSTRIETRVQSRINNRIDRNYSTQTDSASSFTTAADQIRIAGASR